jgi:peptidyl-tRNA hydrolase, PTH1 family
MLLLVGLGNPGANHVGNRHNIGFMVVQAIAARHNIAPWRRRFQGVAVEGPIGSERVLLLLPGTYMNESGRAVAEAARFYKLEVGQVVVFHDELDLAPAKVRVKTGGGVAGHIGHPGDKHLVHPHVLSDFAKSERPWVIALCDIIADTAELLVKGQDATFQNKVHLAMQAKGFSDSKEQAPND